MPLMPMPPMPTKCTRRVRPSIRRALQSRSRMRCRNLGPAERLAGGPTCRCRRRPSAPASGARSLPSARNLAAPDVSPSSSRCIQQRPRRAGPARHRALGVRPLVIVGGRRQRDQDRGLAGRRQSPPASSRRRGRRRRPLRRISPSMSNRNGSTRASQPGALVGVTHHLHVSLARLMGDRDAIGRLPPTRGAASTMATLIACAP